MGYSEIITYSFISPSYYDKIRLPADSPLRNSMKILNPLGEDTSIMRTTILPSMLEIIARNYSYRNKAARLYELGKIYLPREDGLADEPKYLSLGAYGDGVDFFSFKGGIETLLRELRMPDFRTYEQPVPAPGAVEAQDMTVLGAFVRDIMRENMDARNFRIFAPCLLYTSPSPRDRG